MGKGGRVFWQSCRRGESIDYDPRELKFPGGGAGSHGTSNTRGLGGGGGGAGYVNTGGGSSGDSQASGGSGIVIIRYLL